MSTNKKIEKTEQDCRCYAASRCCGACPAPRRVTHPLRYYEFTQEEIRALEECDVESFYRRCLPFSTALAGATLAAVKFGYLRPNPRFGAFPKVTLAVVLGYFVGKLSYQQACAEKLMALPGSYVGQLLRERRDGKTSVGPRPTQSPSMFGAGPGDIYSDAGPGSSLDLDTDRPVFNDNDTFRPDRDTSGGGGGGEGARAGGAAQRDALSYEELRRRNRSAHNDARQDPYKMDPGSLPPLARARPAPAQPESRAPSNKYGDDME